MKRGVAGAVALIALSAGGASAATVNYRETSDPRFGVDRLTYTPAAGEQNNVFVTWTSVPGRLLPIAFPVDVPAVVITDGATPMNPGPDAGSRKRCALLPGLALCSPFRLNDPLTRYGAEVAPIHLGDGDDSINVDLHQSWQFGVFGGPGNDSFAAASTTDVAFSGGPGADDFKGAADGRGTRLTRVTYAGSAPVEVTLDEAPNDGEPGEGDNVHGSIDDVTGSSGNDLLRGHDGGNWFHGGEGDDKLVGLGDFDILEGGPGADRIEGGGGRDNIVGDVSWLSGGGDDVIDARDGVADYVDCGAGDDVLIADPLDGNGIDCEQVIL